MMRAKTEPRIDSRVYVIETGEVGLVKGHYFQYTSEGNKLHSVLVLLDNNEYGTYAPTELTKDIHAVTRVANEQRETHESAEFDTPRGVLGSPETDVEHAPDGGISGMDDRTTAGGSYSGDAG